MAATNTAFHPYHVPASLHVGHHYVMLKFAEKMLLQIPFSSQEKILDIGCRDGKLTAILAMMNPHCQFTALTTTNDYLQQIKKDQTLQTITNAHFQLEELYQFSYPHQFDKVVSFCCLTWFEDKEKIISNIYTALKPGKRAYLQFFVDHGQQWFDECRLQVATQPQWRSHFENFKLRRDHPKPGQVMALAEKLGFIIEESKLRKHKIPMLNEGYFKSWLKSISAHYIDRLQEKSEAFFSEVVKQYSSTHPQETAEIHYEDFLLELILLKPGEAD